MQPLFSAVRTHISIFIAMNLTFIGFPSRNCSCIKCLFWIPQYAAGFFTFRTAPAQSIWAVDSFFLCHGLLPFSWDFAGTPAPAAYPGHVILASALPLPIRRSLEFRPLVKPVYADSPRLRGDHTKMEEILPPLIKPAPYLAFKLILDLLSTIMLRVNWLPRMCAHLSSWPILKTFWSRLFGV